MLNLLNKWRTIPVEWKVVISWLLSVVSVVVFWYLVYSSRMELFESSTLMDKNTRMEIIDGEIKKFFRELEASEKQYTISKNPSDSVIYAGNLDSLYRILNEAESIAGDNELLLKYFLPVRDSIRSDLFGDQIILPGDSQIQPISIITKDSVFGKLIDLVRLHDAARNSEMLTQIQSFKHKLSSNLRNFVIMTLVFITLLTVLFFFILMEMKKKKNLSAQILTSRKELKSIINTAPAIIFVKNTKKEFVLLNKSFLDFFNMSEHNVLKVTNKDIILKDEQWLADIEDDAVLTDKITLKNIVRKTRRGDGNERWLNVNKGPLFDENNNVIGIVGVMDDITKRINFQAKLLTTQKELGELIKQKDKLFSIIAHDLRSPFTALLGFSEILYKECDTLPEDEMKSYIQNMNSSLKNLLALIDNLLNWSRINMKRLEYLPRETELYPIIESVLRSLNTTAEIKSIKLINNCPVSQLAFADTGMIETVIRNLVSNAIKFTKEDGFVEVNVKNKDPFIEVEIKDNGVGIPADKAVNLFHPDSPVQSVGTHGEKGTGLGLIICKEFIEKHGGSIQLNSSDESGTSFSFTIYLHNPGMK